MPENWNQPFPYGFPAAAENAGSVAAPLLAGFSFALVGLVIPAPEHFRWPSATLALLLAGGVAFVAAVQCSFRTRQYAITPEDIDLWRAEDSHERKLAVQHLHKLGFDIWARRLNVAYRAGILLLLGGIALALVPRGSIGAVRFLAIAVAAAGLLAELCWVFSNWLLNGSPSMAYDDQPDEPPEDTRFPRLRRSPLLRKLARAFVPLPRIQLLDQSRTQDRAGDPNR
jgi:hypothetical protein